MQILVAKRAGVCFGVKRAIDIAFSVAKDTGEGVYTLGPLIHNPQVIEKLRMEGVTPIENTDSLKNIKTLIIRTHGVPPKIYEKALKSGCKVIDATCPFVKKAQRFTQTLKEEGYQVLILGDKKHPEVQALLGFAGDNVIVVNPMENNFPNGVNSNKTFPLLKSRVGIIVQTTQPLEALKKIVCYAIDSAKEVKVYNTICDSTALRLEETRELAEKVDLMIVVGGKNSSNTTQLTNLSRKICTKVHHIETAAELQNKRFKGVKKVGITGGASTPQRLIDEVVKKLREISNNR